MRNPRLSPSTRNGMKRIDSMAISSAERAVARAEFERAEAFADRIVAAVDHVKTALTGAAVTLQTRRQRLE